EPEAFELLQCSGAAVDAEHPLQVLGRDREREYLAGVELLEPARPDLVIVPLRAPGDAAGIARLERSGARRVIAAEAQRHHADALGIELAPASEILVDRRSVMLGLGDQRQIAEAHALAVARPVNDQAADATRREIGHRVAVLQLLGHVEAVEE